MPIAGIIFQTLYFPALLFAIVLPGDLTAFVKAPWKSENMQSFIAWEIVEVSNIHYTKPANIMNPAP